MEPTVQMDHSAEYTLDFKSDGVSIDVVIREILEVSKHRYVSPPDFTLNCARKGAIVHKNAWRG